MKMFKHIVVGCFFLLQVMYATSIKSYTLPPEPNLTLTNATLIGVDVNNNNVRDDLERKIIQFFNGDKIYIESTFQMVRAYNLIMQTYNKKQANKRDAEQTHIMVQTFLTMAASDQCFLYISRLKYKPQDGFNNNIIFNKKSILNTPNRKIAYAKYDRSKSLLAWLMKSKQISKEDMKKLDTANSNKHDVTFLKRQCTFDIDALLKEK